MIQILHTADVHLGKQFPSMRSKGSEFRTQLLRTFEKTTDLAVSQKVPLLLIAGDLFDTNRVYGLTIGKVLSAFKKLESSGVRVAILPGTHDVYSEDSVYRTVRFPPNITVFTPGHQQQTYEDLDLTVYGMVPEDKTWRQSPLGGLALNQGTGFHIGMAHCSVKLGSPVDNEAVLAPEDIARSGLDYLALGHWHSFQDFSQGSTRACYSGSPEPIDMDQQGAGNVAMVTLRSRQQVDVEPVRIGTKRAEAMSLDISPLESPESVAQAIESRADPHLILDVTLTGLCGMAYDLNCPELESTLAGRFFNLRVTDQSHPRLEEVKSRSFPEKTVTGRFLKMMEEKIATAGTAEDKAIYEESLKLGFALLQGRSQVIE